MQVPSPDFHIFLVASELQCCCCSWNSYIVVFVEPPPKDLWPFWLLFKRLTFVVAKLCLPETEAQLKLKKTGHQKQKMQHTRQFVLGVCLCDQFVNLNVKVSIVISANIG